MGVFPVRPIHLSLAALMFLALAFAACRGEKETAAPAPAAPASSQGMDLVIVSTDLAVGPNRFVVGLVDNGKKALVIDAQLRFRLFKLKEDGRTGVLKGEMDARPLTLEKNFTHVHEDGKSETHGAGTIGVYVANVDFDAAGVWAVEISGTATGQPLPTLTVPFNVGKQSRSVAVGDAAPRTLQPTLGSVKEISDIDTSNPPDPHMHQITIAAAVVSGKPSVIVFATPGFCHSQTCGPTKDVVDQLYEKHQGRAHFIHVEPYDLEKLRSGGTLTTVPAMSEWRLQSEPWVFLVDRGGRVAAKFEGVVSLQEVESALAPLLAS
jgi:hypothetical protein